MAVAVVLFFWALPAGWALFVAVVGVVGWSFLFGRPLSLGAMDARAWRNFYGPLLVAAGLALISIPILAPTVHFVGTLTRIRAETPTVPIDDVRRWTAIVGCAVPSVLVAATIGAPAVRRHFVTGGIFTFLLALGVAIAALPFVLGRDCGLEIFCLDSCSVIIDSGNPTSGIGASLFYGWAPFIEPVAVATLAVGVAVWTVVVRKMFSATSQPDSGPVDVAIEGAGQS